MGHSSITCKRFSRHAPKPFAPRPAYGPGPEYEAQWRARRRERERLDRLYRNYIKRTIENYKRVTSTIVAHHSHRFSMRPNGRQLKRRERYGLRNTIFFLNWFRALLWLGDSSSRGKSRRLIKETEEIMHKSQSANNFSDVSVLVLSCQELSHTNNTASCFATRSLSLSDLHFHIPMTHSTLYM